MLNNIDRQLLLAAENNTDDLFESLINQGGNINIESTSRAGKFDDIMASCTPLMIAAQKGHIRGLNTLLQLGANINHQSLSFGSTALIEAALYGHVDCVKFLVERGADLEIFAKAGKTALMFSCDYVKDSDFQIQQYLIKRGANVNAQELETGYTPLMRYIFSSSLPFSTHDVSFDIFRTFFDHGVNLSIQSRDGKTTIDFARQHLNKEYVDLLINYHQAYLENKAMCVNIEGSHDDKPLFVL